MEQGNFSGDTFFDGMFRKMKSQLDGSEVSYALSGGDELVSLQELIGAEVALKFDGAISCVRCGRAIKKTYADGYCFPCFQSAPQTSPCIVKPELCEGHLGKGRDLEWEKEHHVQPHVVYLSYTSDFKVGVTRSTQIPVRWIDQGAVLAAPLAIAPYRQLAGAMEVALKDHFKDKTNWRRMLKAVSRPKAKNFESRWAEALAALRSDFADYLVSELEPLFIDYPVKDYPEKVKSVQLLKMGEFAGCLSGIKGQYLIFEDGHVLNVRRHSGYHVSICT